MCGLAGFIAPELNDAETERRLQAMCNAILHRGPDACGTYIDEHAALGMRRLSIIDLEGGNPPLFNEDKSVVVVFNGEIYNHHALRAQLTKRGHVFRTRTDTEVLVHAYEEFGEAMFAHLRGMFAFALWDKNKQELMLARDHSGMKPLSYLLTSEGIVFFSEIRSLLCYLPEKPDIDASSVMGFLAVGYVPDEASILSGVKKLAPAHYLIWNKADGAKIRQYWSLPEVSDEQRSTDDLVAELRHLLDCAVGSHLEADVPLGAFLSGGLDSTTVVSLMRKHAPGRVKTFSVGFAEQSYDESQAAREVAAEFGTEHTDIVLTPDIERDIDTIVAAFDEPFGDPSALPTFFVSRLARESVTVALSGDGGDELFGGYSRYGTSLALPEHPGLLSRALAASALRLPHAFPGRNRLIDGGRSRLQRYFAQLAAPLRLDEGGVGRQDVAGASTRIGEFFPEALAESGDRDFVTQMTRLDFRTYLPGDILTKVDRMSMAVSLEARVPILDLDLVEFAFRLQGSHRVDSSASKKLFRQAIREMVPDFLFQRPKQGFAAPIADWFRGPLRERLHSLGGCSPRMAEYIDESAQARLIREHLSRRRDHSLMLWRLLVLELWFHGYDSGDLSRPPRLPELQAR